MNGAEVDSAVDAFAPELADVEASSASPGIAASGPSSACASFAERVARVFPFCPCRLPCAFWWRTDGQRVQPGCG